jgi:hypothetical protein
MQDSRVQQQVYLDTATGALRYIGEITTPASKFTPGAVITGFLHLGQGKTVSVPFPGEPAFANVGPGMSYPPFFHSHPYSQTLMHSLYSHPISSVSNLHLVTLIMKLMRHIATFQWTGTAGSGNSYWFACPRTGGAYQVMKMVGGTENWNTCLSGLQLVALDYEGASPATVVYES